MSQIAVITGASGGIGHALALELASQGITVIAIARNNNELLQLKDRYPEKIRSIPADITTDEGLERIVHEIKQLKINYLIHNAGIIYPLGKLHKAVPADIKKIIETNLIAPLLLTQSLLPFFSENGGRILNITSVAGEKVVPGAGAYCISKAALNMWTRILQAELPYEIVATDVIPGEVDTGMQKDLRECPIEQFPLAVEFQEAYQEKTLIPPAVCAEFLAFLLLKTTPKAFSEKRWNIYKHYTKPVPLPLNKEKLND
ncbi:sepiapterin reductase [Legionella steigerwaltii]|uniref:Sepiapterin reductase n=1 Tax=Legionella steigerwaltii TaxID=460 RepID=A0A378LE24_9GAMM|nr:SDR family NAD(P)-dependent oxidoreductase [Legionella steigerwaltii]KTD80259.1 sepiapterin reductase [Legionella steigerwaltii]STY22341.1 sepiapterin reductase [Legionella steigerwaltii]